MPAELVRPAVTYAGRMRHREGLDPVELPDGSSTALTGLLAARRSVKEISDEPLGLVELAGALWHAAGRAGTGRQSHASARAQYLVAVTVVVGEVDDLPVAAYRYGGGHELTHVAPGDHREALAVATVDAHWLARCPALVLLSADTAAANDSFRELGSAQGERFAWLEAGLIAQNLYLWAAAAGLGTVFVGGLLEPAITRAAAPLLPAGQTVLGVMPLGRPR